MIQHDGWSHMIVTLMTCVSTLCNALNFISYRDSNIIWCIHKVVAIFAKVNSDAMPKTKKYLTSPSEGTIPYHAIMNCLRCLSLMVHPSWLHDSRFLLGWSLTENIKVVSVHPSVAPSEIRIFLGCAMYTWARTNWEEWGGWGQTSQQDHLVVFDVQAGESWARNTPIERWTRIT